MHRVLNSISLYMSIEIMTDTGEVLHMQVFSRIYVYIRGSKLKYDKIHVKQHDEKDCGAAALSMVLKYWNVNIPLFRLREEIKIDAEGANIYGIILAASKYHLASEALEGDIHELLKSIKSSEVSTPFIARIITEEGFEHFVTVFEFDGNNVYLGDPARYVNKILWEEFAEKYAGQIIVFNKDENFVEIPQTHRISERYIDIIKKYKFNLMRIFGLSLVLIFISLGTAILFGYVIGDVITLNTVEERNITEVHSDVNEHTHSHSHDEINLELYKTIGEFVEPFEEYFSNIWIAVPAILIFYGFQCALSLFRSWLLLHMAKDINQDILEDYYESFIKLPKSFTDAYKAGEILQRMNDTDNIRSALSGAILVVLLDSLYLILGGIILFYVSSTLFGVAIVISICYILTLLYFRKPLRNINYEIMESDSSVMNHIKESVDGAGTIKSFLAEKILTLKADRLFQKYTHKSFVGEFLDNAQEIIISTIDAGGIILLLTVGAWLIMQNNATISEVMTFYFVFGYFSTPVKRLTNLQPMLQSAIIAAERLDDVFETTKENIGGKEENFIDSSILLENVSFRYAHRDRILENVNLNISSNQHIAIIGESGSGKSTLGKLLIKLYLAEEGTIKIGGRQIEEYNLEKLRQQVVYVSQDSYIFRDSLRNNLILGMKNVTDEKIVEICNMCHLGKMLERFPSGLDTILDENGANLSSGERERVNIARALLVNPKILIVDEITSNLDYNLENSIMQLLESLKNTTIVQITHRLSTIKKCDNIIVMKDGKIVESGKFDELFTLKGELYSFLKSGHLID